MRPTRPLSVPSPRRRGPAPAVDTRAALLAAGAVEFSERGFDGVAVHEIARRAGVNKAMIYYHFRDKLGLYREVIRDMFRDTGARLVSLASGPGEPAEKIAGFIDVFVQAGDARPFYPTLVLREMAEGAPRLDTDTLKLLRNVFEAFHKILTEGRDRGAFRAVHPVLAYLTLIGPLMLNAARERVGARPGRRGLPMFVPIARDTVKQHIQRVAIRMLAEDPSS